MLHSKAAPALAVVLALGAVGATTHLQDRSNDSRSAELSLAEAEISLVNLQG